MEEQGLFSGVVAWKQTVLQGIKDTRKESGGLSNAQVAEYLAAKDREAEILCYDIFNNASRQLKAAALWGMVTPEVKPRHMMLRTHGGPIRLSLSLVIGTDLLRRSPRCS